MFIGVDPIAETVMGCGILYPIATNIKRINNDCCVKLLVPSEERYSTNIGEIHLNS